MWIGIIALLFANLLASAINPTFVKLGVQEIPPVTYSALRFIVATAAFLPVFLAGRKSFDRKHLPLLLKVSIFFPLNIILFAIGIQYTTALMTSILYAAVPVIVGFLSHYVIGEKLTKNKIAGAAISLAGISFLLYASVAKQDAISLGSVQGNVLCFIAVLCWSTYFAYSRKLTKLYSPVTTSFFSYALTMLLTVAIVPFELAGRSFDITSLSATAWFSVLIVGTGGSALMYYLMQQGIKRVGAFGASLFQYLSPVLASITAIPILGESFTTPMVLGSALILAGVFYATTYEQIARRNRKHLVQ